jgi:hypothetical protein
VDSAPRKPKALREWAKQSLSANREDPALDLLIGTMIAQLEFFKKNKLAELYLHIQGLFSRMEHPIKTMPGIGSIIGPLIAAELAICSALKAGVRSMPSWPMPAWTPGCARVTNGAAKSK